MIDAAVAQESAGSGKNLVIHIGFGKTGTTALQQFFVDNGKRLLQHGIYYPRSGRRAETAHHYLATAARPGGGTGYESQKGWQAEVADLVAEAGQTPAQTILLSSEVFSGRMIFRELELLKRHFNHITIVMYVRRQDDLIMSSYQQWIKDSTFHLDYEKMEPLPYLFYKSANHWRDFLKGHPGRIVPRAYEKGQFIGGTIFSDFIASVFGIEQLDGFVLPNGSVSNPRLSESALEFKRRLNRFYPEDVAADILRPLLDYSAQNEHSEGKGSWDGSIFPPSRRRLLMADLFEEENAKVAREFMDRPDGCLFFEPLPDENLDWRPPSISVDEAMKIGRYILHLKYPGWKRFKVDAMVEQARKSDDPINAILITILEDIYRRDASQCVQNVADPKVKPRHRKLVLELLTKAKKI
jgi:hypothetical protein